MPLRGRHPPASEKTPPAVGPRAPDYSPEARKREAVAERHVTETESQPRQWRKWQPLEITRRVLIGAWTDGFIHAGNFAYMAMLALFPFVILGGAIFRLFGEESERLAIIDTIAQALPPMVADVITPVARNVIDMRTGWLLWAGAIFGLWTVSSLIETIRDILRRAYGTQPTLSFWRYRILSAGLIVIAVVLLLASLVTQVGIGAAQEVIETRLPQFSQLLKDLAISRIVPALGLFASIYLLFYTLTPAAYRQSRYPKWPGALFVTTWWFATTLALPPLLRHAFTYDLTYGSLSGIMIALLFFWIIGLGMVIGAELNAALSETPEERGQPRGGTSGNTNE